MVTTTDVKDVLICIADLSHFTEFVASSGEKEGQHVISELLQGIIESNQLGLELAEIEGDALFFYLPQDHNISMASILWQCRTFYTKFRNILHTLTLRSGLVNGSLSAIQKLGLKIVLHYGPVGMLRVDNRLKPMGQTVVEAHSLLKNSVPIEEYLLITRAASRALIHAPGELFNDHVFTGEDTYEHLGTLKYYYFDLRRQSP